jgi:hypothetical protein
VEEVAQRRKGITKETIGERMKLPIRSVGEIDGYAKKSD